MKFVRFAAISMVALALLTACTQAPTATPVPTPVPPTKAPVVAPAATPVPPVAAPTSNMLALTVSKTALGSIIADSDGKTLYMYTKDTKDTSACYDACATNWPPLLADKIDAKDGVDAKLIGSTKRTDGKMQVTYNGMPLYYWAKDEKPGDTTGQNVGGVWFVFSADGAVLKPATLTIAKTKLGSVLADAEGRVLYIYTKDTKAPSVSNCYDDCAKKWPVFYAVGKAEVKEGIKADLIGTTTRKDGSLQVTYAGWPLYHWVNDKNPGDVLGQAVGGVWWVLQADGTPIMATSSSSNVKPAAVAPSSPVNKVPPSNGGGYGY